MSKSALITGITGQDGSFLAELLLEKGTWFMVLCVAAARLPQAHRAPLRRLSYQSTVATSLWRPDRWTGADQPCVGTTA